MASPGRACALDAAAALAGGAFFTISTFFLLGAVVWAALGLIDAPLAVLAAGEAIAVIASLVIGVMIVRNALRLAVREPG